MQAQLRILRNGKMSKVVLQLKGPHRLIPSHLKCADRMPCQGTFMVSACQRCPDASRLSQRRARNLQPARTTPAVQAVDRRSVPSTAMASLHMSLDGLARSLQGGCAQLLHLQRLRVHGGDGALPQVRVRQGALIHFQRTTLATMRHAQSARSAASYNNWQVAQVWLAGST